MSKQTLDPFAIARNQFRANLHPSSESTLKFPGQFNDQLRENVYNNLTRALDQLSQYRTGKLGVCNRVCQVVSLWSSLGDRRLETHGQRTEKLLHQAARFVPCFQHENQTLIRLIQLLLKPVFKEANPEILLLPLARCYAPTISDINRHAPRTFLSWAANDSYNLKFRELAILKLGELLGVQLHLQQVLPSYLGQELGPDFAGFVQDPILRDSFKRGLGIPGASKDAKQARQQIYMRLCKLNKILPASYLTSQF